MSCSDEMQQWLLYTCLHMMPLGLLKCTVTWFSAQLSEDESKSILQNIKEGGPLVDKSLASVLCEWVRIGYMGKTSTETIIKELGEMFNSRRCFLSENVMEYYGDSYLHSNMQPGNIMNYRLLETNSSNKAPSDVHNCSSSGSKSTNKYTSRINFYVSPQTWKMSSPQPRFHTQDCSVSSLSNLESRPMDHIFFFHKALKKDLEYLVYASRILDDNVGSVMDFHRRFNLVRFMYQMHSDTEDEIAFPALEAKGKFRNISHSYTIDHNLEFDHFNKVSLILDEISELHVSVSGDHVDMQGEEMLKYRQLCVKLHAMCISVQKLLCDHVEHEEIELWPLFEENFSIAEQEKIIGCMLGRIRAEVLQEMIPWLMTSLTLEEQNAITSLWRKATRNTMFDEWLGEWWEGMKRYNIPQAKEETYIPPSWTVDPLEVVSTYLIKEGFNGQGENLNSKGAGFSEDGFHDDKSKQSGILNVDKKEAIVKEEHNSHQFSEFTEIASDLDKKSCIGIAEDSYQADKSGKLVQVSQKFGHHEQLLTLSPQDLEAAIRRVSRDSALDPRKKAYIIQNLLMRST
ncbi:hypothetical protein RJ639_022665 [Escallonia herrerae]|uniref:Hemerythrin-like domain-containing protein n=1 Tax=Escallonia herrerae TaxID=1293975 RepID=A0AA89AF24_9ASTE|nr:hypothetical protein RJ639_023898 [Escallonia herrerae]KAK2999836.1 hypothetical protein RJ639_022665 [Escallonia herrerae]